MTELGGADSRQKLTMDSRQISERITRMAWINPIARLLQTFVERIYRALGEPGERLEEFVHGKFLGHPLHPVTVHLPLGAWILAAVLDPWGGSQAARMGADLAVTVGFLGALVAMVTGATDYYPYGDASVRRIGGLHAILNTAAIVLYGLSWMLRSAEVRDLARVFSYAGFASVSVSGYLGGLLVYEKRIGTNHSPLPEDETAPESWTTVARLEALTEGKPFRGNAGDVALVLVRRGNGVDALANVCSHKGGPLSEGRVVDGCIECPWHMTQFSLLTGQSVAGPGVLAQPRYPVRIENGDVQVAAVMPQVPLEANALAGRASLR